MPVLSPATVPEASGLLDLGEAWRIVAWQRNLESFDWDYVGGLKHADLRGLSTVRQRIGDVLVLYAHLPPEAPPTQIRGGRMR